MILVLEDLKERVDWLRQTFPRTEIQWCTTVLSFQMALSECNPDVIILDHDLGPGSATSEDADGLTGYDAAKALKTRAPVLIWSWNMWASNRMSEALMNNGVMHKALPIIPSNYTAIAVYVMRVLDKAA